MKGRELKRELRVPRDIEEVFPFFADPCNLDVLMPPWLGLRILTPRPISMWEGTLIDYRLSIRGIPLRWRSEITVWEPPHRFVDEQVRGPYRYWRHEHSFEKHGGETVIRDHVHYRAPGWVLEPAIHRLLVRPTLERLFAYRHARMRERFGVTNQNPGGVDAEQPPASLPPHETPAPPRPPAGPRRS